MIKRTLYFGNPAYLKTKNEQLVIALKDEEEEKQVPMEDIGILLLDHAQITITQPTLTKLLQHNAAVITCNEKHHPVGLFLNLDGHTLQSQRFQAQIAASLPLKKQLWKHTVAAKIQNQAALLKEGRVEIKYLETLAAGVRSGDPDNSEAAASVYYWPRVFPIFPEFRRDREGDPPNNLLNYGYAILRALVARCLTGSGLLPTLGIFHRNQYNAYCLADDIMEPYRPFVDRVVRGIVRMHGRFLEMTPDMKAELLTIPAMDVRIGGHKSPLMVAVQRTTASLAHCFESGETGLLFPELTRDSR